MKKTFTRRMALATLSLALLGAAGAQAQTAYPSQPIKFIVPYPAGGTTDVLARMVAQKMQESWQQTVVVENKPGAGGTIGNNLVAKAPADGYTVLFGIVALVQQMTLMKLPYDPIKDFAPISRVAITPAVFAASTTLPVNNLAELIKLVKANPGKYSFGTYGPGTSAHLQGELLNLQTGIDLLHIPYQGAAPLVTAMLGGQLSTAFMDAGSSRQHIPKFKVLGVTGSDRLSWLPNVPTFKEQGLNSFEPMGWVGLLLPGATPKPVVDKFSAETQRILKLPDVREKIEAMGLIPGGETSDSFGKVMKSDADIYARIIRDAKITLN
jgi:tripartite-type tricarboxylate transporter receptor subunit TctC